MSGFCYICVQKSLNAMDKNGKITIIDVARKAGVSKGTVDRVVHNRGEVSKKSAEKVRKAIEELDYQPNLYASLLASKKAHVIACLLPKYEPGDFWEKIHHGFLLGGDEIKPFNIRTRVFLYDQYDPESFNRTSEEMLATQPSGVVLPPLFKSDTISLAAKLHSLGIPYVYVDTRVEDSSYFAYFGMPMYKSGRLAAYLLTEKEKSVSDVVMIRINRDKTRRSDPTLERRAGFIDYIETSFPDCTIHQVFINPGDPKAIHQTLEAFFNEHGDIRHLVMFNSRVHLLSDYLRSHPVEGRRVVGFDDLDKNIEAVRDGLVTLLISEHAESQSQLAVKALSDYITMYKQPSRRDNYLHMDILTKYNLEDY